MENGDKRAFALLIRKAFSLRGHAEQKVDVVLLGAWWEQLRCYDLDDVTAAAVSVSINEQLHFSVGRILEKIKEIIKSRRIDESIQARHEERAKEIAAPPPPDMYDVPPPPTFSSTMPVTIAPEQNTDNYLKDEQSARIEKAQNYFLDMYRAMKHKGVGGPEMVQNFINRMQGKDPGCYNDEAPVSGGPSRRGGGDLSLLAGAIAEAKEKGSTMLPAYIGPRPLWSYSPKDQATIRKRWDQEFGGEGSFAPAFTPGIFEPPTKNAPRFGQESQNYAHRDTIAEPPSVI